MLLFKQKNTFAVDKFVIMKGDIGYAITAKN